jgi:exodeoxyribonuclease-3
MRIDLVLLTEVLAGRCVGASVDRQARKVRNGNKPSDHAPVVVELSDG